MRKSNANEIKITWPFLFAVANQFVNVHNICSAIGGGTVYLGAYNTIYSKSSINEIYAGHSQTIC